MATRRNPGRPGRDSPKRSAGRDDRRSRSDRDERKRGSDRSDKTAGSGRARTPAREEAPVPPKSWGGVARRGAGRLRDARASKASAAWREATERPEGREQDQWVRVDEVREEATGAVVRGRQAGEAAPSLPRRSTRQRRPAPEVAAELERAAGLARAPKVGARLAEATRAFERERFAEARVILRPLAQRAPGSPAVRELYGLTLYRLGQWKEAMRELEAFVSLTGSTEQHPVLADCARALERWDRVEELWRELREASPAPDLVAEGRIVAAGALADRGELRGAIALLAPAVARVPRRPREHHLRLLYAMADLQERAGDLPAAKGLFRRILLAAPGYADIEDRLRGLR